MSFFTHRHHVYKREQLWLNPVSLSTILAPGLWHSKIPDPLGKEGRSKGQEEEELRKLSQGRRKREEGGKRRKRGGRGRGVGEQKEGGEDQDPQPAAITPCRPLPPNIPSHLGSLSRNVPQSTFNYSIKNWKVEEEELNVLLKGGSCS